MGLFEDILKSGKGADNEQKIYKRYDYKAPPYDLLRIYPVVEVSQEEVQADAAILKEVVSSFLKAQVGVTNVIRGPRVTRYELQVPMGVALKQIELHCADISYELAVPDIVRVEVPIQGKRAVAVEVSNRNKATFGLRDVVCSPLFAEHKSPIPFAVGKNTNNEIVVCDLEKIPHFLIAGQAGDEISAGIDSLIVGLLYKSSPEDVRFILIDSEHAEFSKFRGMPHLLFGNIVTKPTEAVNALEWARKEMDRRYALMQHYNCSKLSEYNRLPDVESGKLSKLPNIVIIIGELAELMQSCQSREVEHKISAIAALARAAGIHIIVATQHPTTDVITGYIKANLTSRIAYNVSKIMDSRIILDVGGAESLTGGGDMLYYPADAYAPMRVQGAFVSDEEAVAVVDYVKNNYECDFDEQAEKFVFGEADA